MLDRRRLELDSSLLLSWACWPAAALAQDRGVAFDAVVGQPRGLPQLPPQGAWGEVINVTSRWIVVQNHSGQQFPIAIDDIQEFLIRWPTSIDALNRAIRGRGRGPDAGRTSFGPNHIDVFEGADRTLGRPTNNSILPNNMVVTTLDPGFNRFMNAWDYAGQNMLYGWAYPVPANLSGIPSRLHVVGNVVDRNGPDQMVRIGLPGNNFATIVPDDSGQMTVTRGHPRLLRRSSARATSPSCCPFRPPRAGSSSRNWSSTSRSRCEQFNPNANR